jgi:hypothetical protein
VREKNRLTQSRYRSRLRSRLTEAEAQMAEVTKRLEAINTEKAGTECHSEAFSPAPIVLTLASQAQLLILAVLLTFHARAEP